jgi:hypothetical protein
MQLAQRRHSQLLAQRQALRRIESRALLIDRVQRRDAAQRLLGDRTAAGGVHVEELAPDVGQAGQFGGAVGKQGFVAHVIVHHQVAAPAMQEGARVGAGAAGLVVEHDDGRAAVVHAGAVGPQIGVAGLAASRVELSHRGFVSVQAIMLPQQFGEPVGQRLQRHADTADPLGQCRASRQYALAGGDLFDPVQRQMVEVFAGRDPRQQAEDGHAAIDDGRRDHSGRHCLGRTAGVLRTDVAVHEERAGSTSSCSLTSSPIWTSSASHWPHWHDSGSWRCSMRGSSGGSGWRPARLRRGLAGTWASSSSSMAARSVSTVSSNSRRCAPTSASPALPKRIRR